MGKRKRSKEWSAFAFCMRPWRNPLNWFYNIRQWFYNWKFVFQRAKYGYCDIDVWNMTDYHTFLLGEMLLSLAENPTGFPMAMRAEIPPEETMTEEQEAAAMAEWKELLTRMGTHFLHAYDAEKYNPNQFWDDLSKKLKETREIKHEKASVIVSHRSDRELERLREMYNRRQKEIMEWREDEYEKGLQLLKAWHDNLWD